MTNTPRTTHEKLKAQALSNPAVLEEYEALNEEFVLLREFIKARRRAGKTQEDMAKSLHTTTSAIGRLETGGGKKRHSPTLSTLRKYARALNCRLEVKLVRAKHSG